MAIQFRVVNISFSYCMSLAGSVRMKFREGLHVVMAMPSHSAQSSYLHVPAELRRLYRGTPRKHWNTKNFYVLQWQSLGFGFRTRSSPTRWRGWNTSRIGVGLRMAYWRFWIECSCRAWRVGSAGSTKCTNGQSCCPARNGLASGSAISFKRRSVALIN